MVIDKDALQDIPENPRGSGPRDVLMRGNKIFPLFLNWPSGPFDTYGDAITDYEQGIYDGPVRHLETPLYLGNDISQSISVASTGRSESQRFCIPLVALTTAESTALFHPPIERIAIEADYLAQRQIVRDDNSDHSTSFRIHTIGKSKMRDVRYRVPIAV